MPVIHGSIVDAQSKMAEVKLPKGAKVRLTTDPAYQEESTAECVWIESTFIENIIRLIDVGTRIGLDEALIVVIVLAKGALLERSCTECFARLEKALLPQINDVID